MSYFDLMMRVAMTVKRFRMFPVFDVAHYILVCGSVRSFTDSLRNHRMAKDSHIIFTRAHPLASWFGCIVMCHAGSFIGNFLLGEPLVTPLQNTNITLCITAIWYLTNYCPFDLFSSVCNFLPVYAVLSLLKEIRRVHSIDKGLNFALKVMPDAHVIPLVFGVLKGTASNHMKVFQRLVCGVWQPSAIEILNPSLVTKYSFFGACLLLLSKTGHLEFMPEPLLHLTIVGSFVVVRLFHYFRGDPFVPVENLCGCLLTGGIIDSFRRALGTRPGTQVLSLSDANLASPPTSISSGGALLEDKAPTVGKSPSAKKED